MGDLPPDQCTLFNLLRQLLRAAFVENNLGIETQKCTLAGLEGGCTFDGVGPEPESCTFSSPPRTWKLHTLSDRYAT